MMSLAFDLRDALRGLRRDTAYALTVVLTLALTIGATTAVFSIVNGVLLKPLAYRESQQLVELRELWRELARIPSLEVNEQHFEYWRQRATSFESMAQYIALPANLTGVGEAAQITVVHTSSSLFDVLGLQAAAGRTLTPDDERSGQPKVTVITDAFWRQRFGGDPAVIGRSLALNGAPHVIVGVLPADVRLPGATRPVAAAPDALVPIRLDDDHVGWVGDHNNAAIGRLRAGVTPERARAELDVLQRQIGERASRDAHETVTLSSKVTPLAESIVGTARSGLLLLLGAIVAVLLIGCSNLANLSLTRTTERLRDFAVRSALGAARHRLIARALLEQLLLAAAGGALAIWIASTALALFVNTAPIDLPRVNEIALDGRVLAFTAAVSIAAAVLVALSSVWRIGRGDMQTPLKSGRTLAGDRHGVRARAMLLTVQVALSVALLVVTGLLSASLIRVLNVDKGFTAEQVLAVAVALPADRYAAPPARLAAYDRLIADVRALPGVISVTSASMLPLTGQAQVNFVAVEGDDRPRAERPSANFRFIAPDFFRTLDIRVVRGRPFADRDRAADRPAPALVSESTAARLWPNADAVGRRFSRGLTGEQDLEVVGIAADARTTSLTSEPPLMVYVPYWWNSPAANRPATSLLIRSAVDPASLASGVRRVVGAYDPDIAVGDARPLTDLVDRALASRRYQVRLFVLFGLVALVIASVGVYGVMSDSVARRRREMNIRVALGAEPSQVLGLVLRQGAVPIVAGLALGAAGALALGGVVAGLLFDVPARDPRMIGAVAAFVGVVGLGTAYTAARRGLAIDPAAALRDE